ncbi:MAG TPA: hypothetical protein VGO04_22400 [Ensifer sp.]|uniref:hypothetical protein n=1 Tax=Ensifer sp. TaxID=1872086 RepID=UPI002E0F6241|nr:hypothetical protein [Ensifer sp.]
MIEKQKSPPREEVRQALQKIDQQPGRRSGADLVNDHGRRKIVHRIEALREEVHHFDDYEYTAALLNL